MKYLRKIIWLVISVVFIASVIIGIGVIFSVKNVNVTIRSYTYGAELTDEEENRVNAEIKTLKDKLLDECGGKLMSYVREKDIVDCFKDSDYVLASCEKIYPCTLNITVTERMETFFIADNDGTFSTYDSLGTRMRSGVSADKAVNKTDNAPNIKVTGATAAEHIKEVAKISSVFAEKFSALRSIVESIYLNTEQENITFSMRCGVDIWIFDYPIFTESKIQAAYNEFISLTGEEKLSGSITVNWYDGGAVAVYVDKKI